MNLKTNLRVLLVTTTLGLAAGLRAQPVLSAEIDGKLYPVEKTAPGEIWINRDGQAEKVPVSATWRLQGDLRESGDLVRWGPSYRLFRASESESRAEPDRPYRSVAGVLHRTGKDFEGKPATSPFLTTWTGGMTKDGVIVLAWVVDGVARHVAVHSIRSDWPDRYFEASGFFRLSSDEARGHAVTLLWQDGRFVAPVPRSPDPRVAEAQRLAVNNDAAGLKALLAQKLNPNSAGGVRGTLLHYAAEAGAKDAVETLLEAGAKVNAIGGESRQTALHLAAANGRDETVRILLAAKAGKNAVDAANCTPLIDAAEAGHEEVVRQLLAAKVNLNELTERNRSAYSSAFDRGYPAIARLILDAGYRHNFKDEQNERVLITQARKGNTGLVQLLLEKGVPATREEAGLTALHAAATAGDPELIGLLLSAGLSPDLTTQTGFTPLMWAAISRREAAARVLLEAGANPAMANKDGNTALHYAALTDAAEMADLLLAHEADLEARNQAGMTALGLALVADSRAAVDVLLEEGAKVDWRGAQGKALVDAVLRLDLAPALERMLADGLPSQTEVIAGWPALTVAQIYRAEACAALLRAAGAQAAGDPASTLVGRAGLTTLPQVTGVVTPQDPRDASENFPEAQVQVEIVVDADGQVLFPRVVRTPDRRLGLATRQAVARWQFTPPMQGEKAVPSQFVLPLSFASSRDRALETGMVDDVPQMITQMTPRFPASQQGKSKSGQVILSFVVNTEGGTEDIRVISSSHPDFEAEAIAALERSRFRPGLRDGEPVRTKLQVPIMFTTR